MNHYVIPVLIPKRGRPRSANPKRAPAKTHHRSPADDDVVAAVRWAYAYLLHKRRRVVIDFAPVLCQTTAYLIMKGAWRGHVVACEAAYERVTRAMREGLH